MLGPDVQKRLMRARDNEQSYRPNATIANKLQEKVLVMLVAPVATGKSFVMNHIVQTDSDFHRVPVFTTRDARGDDEPGMFRTYPHNDASVSRILDQIDNRELVQYAVHPTSGRIYGTTIHDYPGDFNLLATLSGAVEQLRSLPFKRTYVIGLTTNPENWKTWLNLRYPDESEEKTRRIKEAASSLVWLLDTRQKPIVTWTSNSADDPDATVRSIVGVVKYNEQGSPEAEEHARQMLKLTEELI